MNWAAPIRVVGVGSPQGDDAAAWRVVANLRQRLGNRSMFQYHVIDGGQRLLDLVDGRGTLVLIDALKSGHAAGTIHQFSYPDCRLATLNPGSTHGLGPIEALQLAETLGNLPPTVTIYGIEVANCDPSAEMSIAVSRATDSLAEQLAHEFGALAKGSAHHA